jgi:beta-glucosidase/6-phospho-beta-glucosidase/beta-galactosidase
VFFLRFYYHVGSDYEKFRSTPQSQSIAEFPGETFQFGIATAPAHIEDQLDDSWAEWARKGRIPFNDGTKRDLDRLRFWTEPETEIQLAASTGAKLFRFGIDWGRLQPHEPGSRFCSFQGYRIHNGSDDTPFQAAHEYHDQFHGSSFNQKAGERSESSINDQHVMFSRLRADRRAHIPLSTKRVMADRRWACRRGVQDKLALKRYLYIIQLIKRAGMRPHLTLFHHSLPRWANAAQHRGWLNEKTTRYFVDYLRDLIPHLAGQVSDYVVFNEPAVFASLVYGMAMWPGRLRETPDYFSIIFNTPIYKSAVYTAYSNMADVHRQAYSLIHEIHRRKKVNLYEIMFIIIKSTSQITVVLTKSRGGS